MRGYVVVYHISTCRFYNMLDCRQRVGIPPVVISIKKDNILAFGYTQSRVPRTTRTLVLMVADDSCVGMTFRSLNCMNG